MRIKLIYDRSQIKYEGFSCDDHPYIQACTSIFNSGVSRWNMETGWRKSLEISHIVDLVGEGLVATIP